MYNWFSQCNAVAAPRGKPSCVIREDCLVVRRRLTKILFPEQKSSSR